MSRHVYNWSALFVLVIAASAALTAQAQNTAWQLIEQLSSNIIEDAKKVSPTEQDKFFERVDRKLQDTIDFNLFVSGVMGKHASSDYRTSLSAAQRKQLDRQIEKFSEVFRKSLVKAYGNAFLAVSDSIRVETVAPKKRKSGDTEVVIQKLHGLSEQPVTIYYQMKRRDKEWKLHNIAIEKINLGKLYRSQFQSSVLQYKGDLERVIANWNPDSEQ